MLEISTFVVKFYEEELKQKEQLMNLGDWEEVQDIIERLLLININENFKIIKTNFSEPLKLIKSYLRLNGSQGAIGTLGTVGTTFIYRLA